LREQAGDEGEGEEAGKKARGCVCHHVGEVEVEEMEGRVLVDLGAGDAAAAGGRGGVSET
jgi:hypothetical protein